MIIRRDWDQIIWTLEAGLIFTMVISNLNMTKSYLEAASLPLLHAPLTL